MSRTETGRRAGRSRWSVFIAGLLALLLVGAAAQGVTATAQAPNYTPPAVSPFADVAANAPNYREIAWVYDQGISTGWTEANGTRTYRPELAIARDAMAAFLYRLAGKPAFTPPSSSPFSDVPTNSLFYKEITWLASKQITTGWPDGTFRPLNPIAHDAMAAFLYRFAGEPAFTPPATSPFTDVTVGTQFYKEMTWAHSMGIMTASQSGEFGPLNPVTRVEMAVYLYRYVNPAPLEITTAALPSATVGQPYSATLAAVGGQTPYVWQAKDLPSGLTLSGNTISGTPTQPGTASVEITVTDGTGAKVTANLNLNVAAAISITTTSLPQGAVGQAYTATMTATGGVPPTTWTATGPLPGGLTLSATGEITGTPTTAGTTEVTFVATDFEGRTANAKLSFEIAPAALTITTAALPAGTVGDAYSFALSADGGTSPYSWHAENLPAGLSLAGSTISGTPTAAGTSSVKLIVTDKAAREATLSLDLLVSEPLVLTTNSLPSAELGKDYSVTLAASGGVAPYDWAASGLPGGLTLTGNTISGIPTAGGTFDVTVTVSDPDGRSKSSTLSLLVTEALVITTTSLPAATVDWEYSVDLGAAGGTAPYAWQVTGLPNGIVLNGSTLSGTPTAAGTSSVTITVTDAASKSTNSTMTLAVSAADAGLTLLKTVTNPYGAAAAATNWTLQADGPGSADLSGAGGVARTPVPEGIYTLSETGSVPGYANGTTWSCADSGGSPVPVTNNQVTLTTGADVSCSITNTANSPYLTLAKNVTNPYGTPAAATNWTLKADGPGSTDLSGAGGVARTPVVEGTYTLSETGSVAGYANGTTWSCSTAAGPVTVTNNQVTLTTGADVSCTITNTASTPYLTLVKNVVNQYGTPAAATNWTLKADGPGSTDLSGAGGVARTAVVEGSYTLSETGPVAGYANGTTWSCSTAAGPVTVTNNQVTLTTAADVTCTVTNTANAPHLALVKKVVNAAGPAASATNWTLKADGPGSADLSGAGGVARTPVVEGAYTLSETGSLTGYTNGTTWTCADATGNPVAVTNNKVSLTTGADVACTITNTAAAAAKVTPGSSAPTAVYRYYNSGSRDWVTVPAHGDFGVPAGFGSQSGPQYYVPLLSSDAGDMVAIYRWYGTADADWVDLVDGNPPAGYTQKTFQHYLFKNSGTNRVAVNRWWQPTDRDWLTVSANEYPDATLQSWGYTNKTLLGYGIADQGQNVGYFTLGNPQAAVVSSSYAPGEYPHTMSVLDVNPAQSQSINEGYRYLGYFGHNDCGGINIARSNSLDAALWNSGGDQPWFPGDWPCRWAFGAIADGSTVAMVVNEEWDTTITLQMSQDGLNGTDFGSATVLVNAEGTTGVGNPTLFRDPTNNRYYLYFYRVIPGTEYLYEIRVKSATTIAGLRGSGPNDLGTRVALSRNVLAAPSMIYVNGIYYLAVETMEAGVWKSRIMTGTSPTGAFYEIPGNPLYGDGAACVFQHQFGNELHSWYCKQTQPGNAASWRLDHVKGNLLSPN